MEYYLACRAAKSRIPRSGGAAPRLGKERHSLVTRYDLSGGVRRSVIDDDDLELRRAWRASGERTQHVAYGRRTIEHRHHDADRRKRLHNLSSAVGAGTPEAVEPTPERPAPQPVVIRTLGDSIFHETDALARGEGRGC